jgi:hypothetical protein
LGSGHETDRVSQRSDRLVVRAGLPPVRLHDLRHVAASLTYQATKDLKLTSQMLGHSSTAINEQVYTSVFEDVELEAAEFAVALVPRAHRAPTDADVPTSCPPASRAGARSSACGSTTSCWPGSASNSPTPDRQVAAGWPCAA